MIKFLLFLFLSLANASSINVDTLRLNPSTLPTLCNNGDLKIDSASSNSLKLCNSNAWSGFLSNPFTTQGDMVYYNSGAITRLGIGSGVLTSTGTAPAWATNFTAGTITASLVGNASTATALAANPADCGSNTYATTIAANGDLTCASITNAATTGTASNTGSTLVLRDGSGNFAAGTITATLTGNSSTATALAANPTDCSANQFATTIAANGDLTCAQPTVSNLSALTASRVLASDGSGIISASSVASTTLGYLDATSSIQTQLDTKAVSSPRDVQNLGLTTSVSSNALTIALKQADGSTDPSTGGSAVKIAFRSSTATTGGYNLRSVTSSLSVVIPSGTTIGTISAIQHYLWIYALDNAGTVELAVSMQGNFDEGSVQTSSAISGGSSNRTLYSTTARSNVPIRLIGRIIITEATAGTWASNATEVTPTVQFEKAVIFAKYHRTGAATYSTTAPFDFNTKDFDQFNTVTTGANWAFTAPIKGVYCATINSSTRGSGTGNSLNLYKNGSSTGESLLSWAVTSNNFGGTACTQLAAGDTIDLRPDASLSLQPGYVYITRVGDY